MITKRDFVLRGSCFCEKYNIALLLADFLTILIIKILSAQTEVAPSYHIARVLYFLVVMFEATILQKVKIPVFSKTS